MTLHQQWRDYICDPSRPARFLSSIGRAVTEARGKDIDQDVLATFLERLSHGSSDAELLATAIDLSHGGYAAFCSEQLPALLDALANERLTEDAVVGPALRGNPRWDRTLVARRGGRIPSTHFVTRLPTRSFALPENQLVRWLLGSLARAVADLAARVGSAALPDGIARIGEACDAALAHQWLRAVPVVDLPTAPMFVAASRQRMPGYRMAADLARRRVARDSRNPRGRWLRTMDFLTSNWLKPVETDDLFELFALALVLDVLETDLGFGPAREYGLMLLGRDHVAIYDLPGGGTVRVFFDQSPRRVLGAPSEYRRTIHAHHGVTGAVRRPDVMIVHDTPGDATTTMFVEVKETGQTRYASDSIYKAFGYLHDYQSLWFPDQPGPRLVLLFPEDVAPRQSVVMKEQDVLLISSAGRSILTDAIRTRFAFA